MMGFCVLANVILSWIRVYFWILTVKVDTISLAVRAPNLNIK